MHFIRHSPEESETNLGGNPLHFSGPAGRCCRLFAATRLFAGRTMFVTEKPTHGAFPPHPVDLPGRVKILADAMDQFHDLHYSEDRFLLLRRR